MLREHASNRRHVRSRASRRPPQSRRAQISTILVLPINFLHHFFLSTILSFSSYLQHRDRQSAMESEAESSRIFIRGLPPTMSEADFKKHFGKYEVTDARLFPQRRIGYVGYKSPEDAQKAVKYFNRTFIRMSKIGVELARPVRSYLHIPIQSSANCLARSVRLPRGGKVNRHNTLWPWPSCPHTMRTPSLL
jgi:hypothetical protein